MIRIAAIPERVDLAPFSRWLDSQGVTHVIEHDEGHQVLFIEGEQLRQPVTEALTRYLEDPRHSGAPEGFTRPRTRRVVAGHWQAGPRDAPFTFALIVAAALIAWMTAFGAREQLMVLLTIVNPYEWPVSSFEYRLEALTQTVASLQLWRLVTPDLLHFSLMHLIFNGVMLWFLGSQIEAIDGRGHMVALVLVTSLGGNIPQFLFSGPLFGGLSGVVYGVLGYVWLCNQGRPRFQFPPALMTVAVVWLLIGFTPLTEALLGASMANAAHLGGLLSGLAYAMVRSANDMRRGQ
ncbi:MULTISPECIES: rhomboid family intramembrane serine protease [Gammaproteobacteria]|uniref:Rhomboid family intramembrane serine protease n=1 Tax=Vreelandella halophila TaxID=86177 RepID=A0A9X5B4G4_9GAMM|nr:MULTISPECIES: rhomboid family intramembrane serine protease [Gammaproteobacteria]KAA8977061.1 rhomboid family intramembrane serine protease [Halospina sp. K52047b]MYL26350.1 rhomboid family intramembrane serine protease [Halomonas utahensis]MYL73687.1 rhomboid family intramembrane serine protease [Halomonas sp. 22501_18_FS]